MVEKGHDSFIFSIFIAKREMMITVAITADRVAPPTHYLPALMKIYCCEKLSSKCRRCFLCYNLHITKQLVWFGLIHYSAFSAAKAM